MSDPRAAVVERLWRAQRDGGQVPPPSADLPRLDEDEGYAIQRELIGRFTRAGETAVGWKVGMTADTDGPIYGRLLGSMLVPDAALLATANLIEPAVEGEIAFLLDRPLRGPGVTVTDVRAATAGVLPAIEVIAGRLTPGVHGVADLVADNAASAHAVLGAEPVPLDGLDLRLVGMVLSRTGEVVATGAGARVLGDPALSIAWLANRLAASGEQLDAGTFVLSGGLAPAVSARPGELFTVELDRLGAVSVAFG